jgi:hypothetical protein
MPSSSLSSTAPFGVSCKRNLIFDTKNIYYLWQNIMGKHAQSIDSLILERIQSHGPGWVFTPSHFTDLGSRTAVASALKRHKQAGAIRQIARGLYEMSRQDQLIGQLSPSVDAIVKALQARDAIRLQPSGGYAANLLGLSEQVPMKIVLLTDGRARRVQLGKQLILLKHTTPRAMATAGRVSGLVIQALRHIGQRNVDARWLPDCERTFPTSTRSNCSSISVTPRPGLPPSCVR